MVKLVLREGESIQEALRRFRKLVERSGIKKEMRRRSITKNRVRSSVAPVSRAERRARRQQMLAGL